MLTPVSYARQFLEFCEVGDIENCEKMLKDQIQPYNLSNNLLFTLKDANLINIDNNGDDNDNVTRQNPFNFNNQSPLDIAIRNNNIELCSLLCKYASQVETEWFLKAIHSKEIISVLLDGWRCDDHFEQFLNKCLEENRIDIFEMTLEHMCTSNDVVLKPQHVLNCAISLNLVDIVKKLIHAGFLKSSTVKLEIADSIGKSQNIEVFKLVNDIKFDEKDIIQVDDEENVGFADICVTNAFLRDITSGWEFFQKLREMDIKISFKYSTFFSKIPKKDLLGVLQLTLQHVDDKNLNLISRCGDHWFESIYPQTLLSYLASLKAFDECKYILDTIPIDKFEPSHLVICSLIRSYGPITPTMPKECDQYFEFFNYLLSDTIRPYILGKDEDWIAKSIFFCIRFGSPEMCLKLFSFGYDKDSAYIDVYSEEVESAYMRYNLLSYACKYQTIDVVEYLIKDGVCIDGVLVPATDLSIPRQQGEEDEVHSDGDGNDGNDEDIVDNDASEDGAVEFDDAAEDGYDDNGDGDGDVEDEDFGDDDDHGDETNPADYYFTGDIEFSSKMWFEPYFNPYRVNRNQDLEVCAFISSSFDPSKENAMECFLRRNGVANSYCSLINMTPLATAIRYRRHDLVQVLLQQGANPNANAIRDFPPLYTYCASPIFITHYSSDDYIQAAEDSVFGSEKDSDNGCVEDNDDVNSSSNILHRYYPISYMKRSREEEVERVHIDSVDSNYDNHDNDTNDTKNTSDTSDTSDTNDIDDTKNTKNTNDTNDSPRSVDSVKIYKRQMITHPTSTQSTFVKLELEEKAAIATATVIKDECKLTTIAESDYFSNEKIPNEKIPNKQLEIAIILTLLEYGADASYNSNSDINRSLRVEENVQLDIYSLYEELDCPIQMHKYFEKNA